MTFTPHISIYPDNDTTQSEFGHLFLKATWIFSKHLGYDKKLQRKRVNILLGNEDGISSFKSITSIHIKNPFASSIETSEIDKINQILEIIHKALKTIGSTEGWHIDRIDKAYQLAIQDNGQFVWTSELKSNKKKNLKAQIKFILENEGMVKIISEVTENSSGIKYEIPLIETFPHFFDWDQAFKKPIWIADDKYGFSLIDSQLLIFADIDSRQSKTVISEISWTKEVIEGHLRMLTFRKMSNSKEFAEWANR